VTGVETIGPRTDGSTVTFREARSPAPRPVAREVQRAAVRGMLGVALPFLADAFRSTVRSWCQMGLMVHGRTRAPRPIAVMAPRAGAVRPGRDSQHTGPEVTHPLFTANLGARRSSRPHIFPGPPAAFVAARCFPCIDPEVQWPHLLRVGAGSPQRCPRESRRLHSGCLGRQAPNSLRSTSTLTETGWQPHESYCPARLPKARPKDSAMEKASSSRGCCSHTWSNDTTTPGFEARRAEWWIRRAQNTGPRVPKGARATISAVLQSGSR
jgi:hypothetical protein